MPKRMATVRMDDDPSIRRSFISPDQLLTRPDGDLITTVSDIFPYAVSPELHGSMLGKGENMAEPTGNEIWGSHGVLLSRYRRHSGREEDCAKGWARRGEGLEVVCPSIPSSWRGLGPHLTSQLHTVLAQACLLRRARQAR